MSLRDYQAIRARLRAPHQIAGTRKVSGTISLQPELRSALKILWDAGHIESSVCAGRSFDLTLRVDSVASDTIITITLNPKGLHYYENIDELLRFVTKEPAEYFIDNIAFTGPGSGNPPEVIAAYRDMLKAKELLKRVADVGDAAQVIFMVPEKLVIPFKCREADLRILEKLDALDKELDSGAKDLDQRIMLFKRSLRDHLRSHPVEDHFGLFLRNFESIYDSYHRDFELWLGTTFGEIEKSFEEKRLKFVTDLNSVLGAIQASILAVPLAAVVVIDKFEAGNTLKNNALSGTAFFVGLLALWLLKNQQHTLDATGHAIDAVRKDFEKKKHNYRKEEFTSRLNSILEQERRVRCLLYSFRIAIGFILMVGFCVWLYALFVGFQGKAVPAAP